MVNEGERLIFAVMAICAAAAIIAGWALWQSVKFKRQTVSFEPEQRLVRMTFDEYCDHFGITDEEAPAALAAYLNYVSGWDGTYGEYKGER